MNDEFSEKNFDTIDIISEDALAFLGWLEKWVSNEGRKRAKFTTFSEPDEGHIDLYSLRKRPNGGKIEASVYSQGKYLETEIIFHLQQKERILSIEIEYPKAFEDAYMQMLIDLSNMFQLATDKTSPTGISKPGRPSHEDDLWAIEQLRNGRPKDVVRAEWEIKPGVKKRDLKDRERTFKEIVRKSKLTK